MSDVEIYDKIVAIIKPFSKNQAALAAVGPTTKILDDLKVNSARLVDILLAMEEQFGVDLADEDADGVRTVGDAVQVVAAKLK